MGPIRPFVGGTGSRSSAAILAADSGPFGAGPAQRNTWAPRVETAQTAMQQAISKCLKLGFTSLVICLAR